MNELNERCDRKSIDARRRRQSKLLVSHLADVRSKITRATQNLALAEREDIPGISRLLAGWRETESEFNDQLRAANGQHAPSPEAIEIISKRDKLLDRLGEADRELQWPSI